MSLTRYLIHVGPHKTGTTYLQAAFAAASGELAAHGITYPAVWLQGHNHVPLSRRLRTHDATLAHDIEALDASGCKRVLVSAEDFSALKDDAVQFLHQLLGDRPVQIIFYLRRWSELLPSAWQETVKHGFSHTFPEYIAKQVNAPPASTIAAKHLECIGRYASVFGQDSIRLVSYSNLTDSRADLFAHFCETFLDCPTPTVDTARKNTSLSAPDAEVLRMLNAMARARTAQSLPNLPQHLRRIAGSHAPEVTAQLQIVIEAMSGSIGTLRLRDDASWLNSAHRRLFAAYGSRILPPTLADRCFQPKVVPVSYVEQTYLMADGVPAALNQLYEWIINPSTLPERSRRRALADDQEA